MPRPFEDREAALWPMGFSWRDGLQLPRVGSRKRVREGTRHDPRLGNFKTGQHSRPETWRVLEESTPRFAALIEYYAQPENRPRLRSRRRRCKHLPSGS